MGIEEKLPSGMLLTTVEQVVGYFRKGSFWPATFGLACCAIEMMTSGGPRYDLGRDRKSTRLNSSHSGESRMPSSA